jgi:hypothetical protein
MTPVLLSAIVEGMDFQSDQMTSYLHRPTGRVLWVTDEAFRAAEGDDEDSVEPEELADARGILASSGDYLALPDRFEIDEYRMMEDFAMGLDESGPRDATQASLHGAKAFRRFKDTIHRLGLSDDWYAYRERAYTEVARTWCEANGIELDVTLG